MYNWYELGEKVACIELVKELCEYPIFPNCAEDIYYEIYEQMDNMGLDGSVLQDATIESYYNIILKQITEKNQKTFTLLFFLGNNIGKLKIIITYDIDEIVSKNTEQILEEILNCTANYTDIYNLFNTIDINVVSRSDIEQIEKNLFSIISINYSESHANKAIEASNSISIDNLVNNVTYITGDVINSSVNIGDRINNIQKNIRGNNDEKELQETLQELKEIIQIIDEKGVIPKKKGFFEKLSRHIKNNSWFYIEVIKCLGQAILKKIQGE